ncbi:hypothetical protein [Rhizobium sp.]
MTMPYSPAERLLSVSFERRRDEHADAMFDIGRRMMTENRTVSPWIGFAMAIGLGVVVGATMEVHRRFIMPVVFGITDTAPLGTAILQFLPLLLIAAGVYAFFYMRTVKGQRAALTSRIRPGLTIDIEIFEAGVAVLMPAFSMEVDWPFVSDVYIDGARIEIECESLSIYIPERAFPDRATHVAAYKQIRGAWQDAAKRERDRRMLEAGID